MSRTALMGLAAWVGIPLLHVVWMLIDWNLRDPRSPMSGGIPDGVTTVFQWVSLAAFGILVFASVAGVRPVLGRAAIAVFATGIAFVVMLFGWLSYVIGNGIDTL